MGFVVDFVKLLQVLIKNSGMISWQVMFFNVKSLEWKTLIYVPTINVLERKLLTPSSYWGSSIYTPWKKRSSFPESDLLSQLNMDKTYN